MAVSSLEEAKGLLYGADQASFISSRDAIVKELRQAKNRELAAEVKALRKPSAVAAEVNRVVRCDPGGVELILQAAELLRAAQSGELDVGVTMSELQTQYRAAIRALAQTAENRRAEVRAALEAATIDVASNDALRSGSLVVVPEPVSIFGIAPPAPVDELALRRARRQSAEAAEGSKKKSSPDKAAKEKLDASKAESQTAVAAAKAKREAAAKEVAAKETAAKEAAAKEAQLRAERKKRHKDLEKQHRRALRSHLDALDGEAEADGALEAIEAGVHALDVEVNKTEEQIAELQRELVELSGRKAQAATEQEAAAERSASARQRTADAEQAVQQLAETLKQLETELATDQAESEP